MSTESSESGTLSNLLKEDRRFEPSMDAGERERLLGRWRRAVERAKGWARDE